MVDAKTNKPIKGMSIQLNDNEDKAETTGSSFSVTITNPQQVEVSAPGYITDVVLVNDRDKCLVKLRKEGSGDEEGDDAADGHNDVDAKDDADDD